jgi:hypothetical protein
VAKNKCSSTYTATICLHEMHRSYSTDVIFITKGHDLNFMKKENITFKPRPTTSMTLFMRTNVPLKSSELQQLIAGVETKGVPTY